jgi:hypothetical protein
MLKIFGVICMEKAPFLTLLYLFHRSSVNKN